MEPRKRYSCGQRISPRDRTQSRRCPVVGRQQSRLRQGKRVGHHRGLRAGHVYRGVARELGRASRLLGSKSRNEDDRLTNILACGGRTPEPYEPTPVRAGRDTNEGVSTQGTGREPQANRPGRTKAVLAEHSTAGRRARLSDRTGGEPMSKGPTERKREGEAGHDVCDRERQEGH